MFYNSVTDVSCTHPFLEKHDHVPSVLDIVSQFREEENPTGGSARNKIWIAIIYHHLILLEMCDRRWVCTRAQSSLPEAIGALRGRARCSWHCKKWLIQLTHELRDGCPTNSPQDGLFILRTSSETVAPQTVHRMAYSSYARAQRRLPHKQSTGWQGCATSTTWKWLQWTPLPITYLLLLEHCNKQCLRLAFTANMQ